MQGGDSANRTMKPPGPTRDAFLFDLLVRKKNKSGYHLFFRYLIPLAKREQKRYKMAGITDCPAFIDDQGVMYHGSEFFAACRG